MIRLFHAKLLLLDESGKFIITPGEVWIKDHCIYKVITNNSSDILEKGFSKQIDCEENLLMPGLANMHTHSAMVFLRSLAEDLPLDRWLNESVFPMEALLTKEDVKCFTKLAILEYLRNGITSIFDMYHFEDGTYEACNALGMRLVLCGNINDYTGSVSENREKLERLYTTYQSQMASFRMGCHAEYTSSLENLTMLSELSHQNKTPVYAHMSETKAEVDGCIKRYKMSPVALFEKLGLWDYGGGIFHGIWLLDSDYEIIKRRNLCIVSNPASNLKLDSGIAPLTKLKKEKIPFCFGTDGAASNNALDMFREMYLGCVLQKLKENNAVGISADDILKAAIYDGPCAILGKNSYGISKGRYADLILLDLHAPNLNPDTNIVSNIIYSAHPGNVLMTMINGIIRYHNGQYYLDEAYEDIVSKANERLQILLNKNKENLDGNIK